MEHINFCEPSLQGVNILRIHISPWISLNVICKPFHIRNVKSVKIYLGKPPAIDLHKLKTMNKCF